MLHCNNYPRRPRLAEVYKYDRARALEMCFDTHRQAAHLWCSRMGPGGVRYGSYRTIGRVHLIDRQYEIEWIDGTIGIFFTDECYYNPHY